MRTINKVMRGLNASKNKKTPINVSTERGKKNISEKDERQQFDDSFEEDLKKENQYLEYTILYQDTINQT